MIQYHGNRRNITASASPVAASTFSIAILPSAVALVSSEESLVKRIAAEFNKKAKVLPATSRHH